MILFCQFTPLLEKYRASEERLQWLSKFDSLTGLANYHHAHQELEMILAKIHHNHNGWAFLLDISHLQRINDAYGHKSGDAVIIHVANGIKSLVPVFSARVSGNTFLVVDILAQGHQPHSYARTLKQLVGKTATDGRRLLNVQLRISAVRLEGADVGSILHRAEFSLRSLKHSGKAQGFVVYETSLEQEDGIKNQLAKDLQVAIDEPGQLELFYQPIWDINNRRLKSFESLLRWAHPTMGYVSPVQFIPLAEQRSLIIPLGLLAFEQACKTLLGWKRKGFEALGSQFRLSINMAPPQFSTPNFIEEVENVLQAWHASPEDICIEITETSLMENQALAARRIAILKQMGCSIAIDDFGTGYSSLAYLQQFDVDIIKIDRSITKNVATCKSAQKIAQAIIQLGHSLDIQIVAEGVETPAQLTTLQNYGCDAIQGFIAGKPVPASDAEMWLNNPVFPIDIPAKNKLAAEKCCNE